MAVSACAGAEEPIALEYNERPPYLTTRDGELSGLTGSPAVTAFRASGIPFELRLSSAARQIADLQANEQRSCTIGWFRTAEREVFAKFTRPIYRDRPQVALTQTDNPHLGSRPIKIEQLLSNPQPILLTKQGYSYGSKLDELIARLHPRNTSTFEENLQMIRVLDKGRADYMLIAPEEAGDAIAQSGVAPSHLRTVAIADAPLGEFRYILCSRNVDDKTIARLNAVLPPVR
jgi:uncharacterized protein (TIGR02285 family)